MIGRCALLAAGLAVAIPGVRVGAVEPARCVTLSSLISPAAFARYPAHRPRTAVWRGPDVRSGEAHRYRTVLHEQVAGAPDFAGRFTVVHIGCGAGLVCPALVDRLAGRVSYPPAIRSVYFLPARTEPAGASDPLQFQAGSRLLVILGARNEDERTSGVTQFDWRAGRLHFLRFVPEPRLCRSGQAYQ